MKSKNIKRKKYKNKAPTHSINKNVLLRNTLYGDIGRLDNKIHKISRHFKL